MWRKDRIALAICLTLLFVAIPTVALAHDENTLIRFGPFLAGLTEPLLAFQFILGAFATGIIATQIGGKGIWQMLGLFVGLIIASVLIGLLDPGIPVLEFAIPLTILILGAAILIGQALPVAAAFGAVGLFSIVYGYAVGVDISAIDLPLNFLGGFLVGMIPLYLIGIILGDIPKHYGQGPLALKVMGGLASLCGVLYLIGVF